MKFSGYLIGLILSLLIIYPIHLFALDPILIGENEDNSVDPDKLEILEDSLGMLSISDVTSSVYVSNFRKNKDPFPNIKNIHSAYWVRFKVTAKEGLNKRWVLEILDPHFDSIEVYLFNEKNQLPENKTGFSLPFSNRKYLHKNFIFDLDLENNESLVVYVKAQSRSHNVFLFKIRTANYFTFYALNEYYILGLFYGILGIMALYNLLLFFSVKESFYLYYVLYVLSCAIVTFAEDGLGFQYLWPSNPHWNTIITYYSSIFYLLCFTLYSRSFLELDKNLPLFSKIIYGAIVIYIIYLFSREEMNNVRWDGPVHIIPYLLIYLAAVLSYKKRFKPARFFILGYTFVLISLIILIFRMNAWVSWDNIFTIYSFNISLVFEIVILSLALGDKIKIIKNEKELAQTKIIEQLTENEKLKDKVNRELEDKVRERTSEIVYKNEVIELKNVELKQAYDRVQEQAEKIKTINKLLEAENITLVVEKEELQDEKKELEVSVKELSKARIFLQDVDFAEFNKMFPDKETCMSYLSDLKWHDHYSCFKCGNGKYFEGHDLFSRRCTRCGYDESPTVQTIFHRQRFPIDKAFYMLFLIYSNNGKISSVELSEILSIRQSTCWTFRKKVKEKMQAGKKNKIRESDGWGWVIRS